MLWYNIKALDMNKQSLLIDQLEVNRLLIDEVKDNTQDSMLFLA